MQIVVTCVKCCIFHHYEKISIFHLQRVDAKKQIKRIAMLLVQKKRNIYLGWLYDSFSNTFQLQKENESQHLVIKELQATLLEKSKQEANLESFIETQDVSMTELEDQLNGEDEKNKELLAANQNLEKEKERNLQQISRVSFFSKFLLQSINVDISKFMHISHN